MRKSTITTVTLAVLLSGGALYADSSHGGKKESFGEKRSSGVERSSRSDRSDQTYKRADRKSTRLNSRHQINSYAVFCLKKKKT